MASSHTFRKEERLCSKKVIDLLYSSSDKAVFYPLNIRWTLIDSSSMNSTMQVLIVAPKRRLHHAVDRNRTKRVIRECWRLQKQTLLDILEQQNLHLAVGINYMDDTTPDYNRIYQAVEKAIARITALLKIEN